MTQAVARWGLAILLSAHALAAGAQALAQKDGGQSSQSTISGPFSAGAPAGSQEAAAPPAKAPGPGASGAGVSGSGTPGSSAPGSNAQAPKAAPPVPGASNDSASASDAAAAPAPALVGRVVDDAGLLDPASSSRLAQMLAAHEKATGQQVVVVTVPSLRGVPIEDFGYQLGRRWGIGEKGKDNGALLIVARDDRKVRIEVGYGLEGTLTDAISSSIINQIILPAFRQGDFNKGIVDGTSTMLKVLSGDPDAVPQRQVAAQRDGPTSIPVFVILLFIVIVVISRMGGHGMGGRRRGSVLPGAILGGVLGSRGRYGGPGGFGDGGGGFGGGGGFTGGGGSFGGGGASGNW